MWHVLYFPISTNVDDIFSSSFRNWIDMFSYANSHNWFLFNEMKLKKKFSSINNRIFIDFISTIIDCEKLFRNSNCNRNDAAAIIHSKTFHRIKCINWIFWLLLTRSSYYLNKANPLGMHACRAYHSKD